MVSVTSRFRVANGMEAAVREAFLNRPGLVDSVAGFLGMEVYTDHADPTLFYLVTRWSDLASYEAWHASDAHHESHRFIPKGLKLDPNYTKVTRMERIEQDHGEPPLDEHLRDVSIPRHSRGL